MAAVFGTYDVWKCLHSLMTHNNDVILYIYIYIQTWKKDEIIQAYHQLSLKKNITKNYLHVYRVFQEESAIIR